MALLLFISMNFIYYCNCSLTESLVTNTMLQSDIKRYQNCIKELENLNQVLRDEHQALQLAFAALEEKLRKAQVFILAHILNFCICFIKLSCKCEINKTYK